jgi:serine/threonine protein kinase
MSFRSVKKTRVNLVKGIKGRKTNKTIKNIGGKVIASGGYGCIFRPALKCKGQQKKQRDSNQLSKLMTVKHAKSEYEDIVKYKKIFETIPNYKDYFLVDGFSICEPEKLTQEDLTHFKSTCTALPKKEITQKNINQLLDKVLAINMPDGGIDVGHYLKKHKKDEELIQLNNLLIDLLLHGIVPMNKKHVYHCDIKESNILIKSTTPKKLYARLIDWGLSATYVSGGKIPKSLMNRPFQYNTPFSTILFNSRFDELYDELLSANPNPEYYLIRGFVIEFCLIWLEERGLGHYRVINDIIVQMFAHDFHVDTEQIIHQNRIDEYMYTYYYIVEYLTKILYKYTRDGEFDIMDYFNNVFIHNVDIWGFLVTYLPILEDYYNDYDILNVGELKVFEKIRHIVIHYLFETATEVVDVEDLAEQLKGLNILFSESKQTVSNRAKDSYVSKDSSIFTDTSLENDLDNKQEKSDKLANSSEILEIISKIQKNTSYK